jgi:hypothetical protein
MLNMQFTVNDDPVFHIIIDHFLGEKKNKEIFDHIVSLKNYFKPDGTGRTNRLNKNMRTNLTCYVDGLFYKDYVLANGATDWPARRMFRAEKSPLLATVDNMLENDRMMKQIMDSTPFPLCKFRQMNTWQTQISRYGEHMQFYAWHIDRGGEDKRLITLIYYLHNLPKKFRGGKLCLTNGLAFDGKLLTNSKVLQIEPRNDRLVIFNSRTLHCVKSTSSPAEFADGRFSVNIWLGRRGAFDNMEKL